MLIALVKPCLFYSGTGKNCFGDSLGKVEAGRATKGVFCCSFGSLRANRPCELSRTYLPTYCTLRLRVTSVLCEHPFRAHRSVADAAFPRRQIRIHLSQAVGAALKMEMYVQLCATRFVCLALDAIAQHIPFLPTCTCGCSFWKRRF